MSSLTWPVPVRAAAAAPVPVRAQAAASAVQRVRRRTFENGGCPPTLWVAPEFGRYAPANAQTLYIFTCRRGADTAHTQMGRPTHEAPNGTAYTRDHTHKLTQTHTNTHKHTARPDKVYTRKATPPAIELSTTRRHARSSLLGTSPTPAQDPCSRHVTQGDDGEITSPPRRVAERRPGRRRCRRGTPLARSTRRRRTCPCRNR